MTGPNLDFLLGVLNLKNYNPVGYDSKVTEKINILYDNLDRIKPIGDDEYKVLYFSLPKGKFEETVDYQEMILENDLSNIDDAKKYFDEDYPDDVVWYKMITTVYKNYRMVSINSKTVVYADMDMENAHFENSQLQELLDLLIDKVKECIRMLEDGSYNQYILDNYSYRNRFGVIKRDDYWKVYPDAREELLEDISLGEIEYFIDNASEKAHYRIKTTIYKSSAF